MNNSLNDDEVKQLIKLGKFIKINLDCNSNRLPCLTDRLESVKNMKKYLEIHNYKIEEK